MMARPTRADSELSEATSHDAERIESSIIEVRGERVILDSELAQVYGVTTKRLNEQVKRNAARFGGKYVFQLTEVEFANLRSQSATSSSGHGGRRTAPWAFTEHGVVMVATVLDSDKAIKASQFVVDVFIELKHRLGRQPSGSLLSVDTSSGTSFSPLERLSTLGHGMGERLQLALNHVLDSVIDTRKQSTIREEAQTLISESIQHLKDRLKKQGLENEEISARVVKLLAEAEKEKAIAAKTRAETEKLEFAMIVRKLRLLLEVQRAIEHDRVDGFLDVLKEMGDH
jgi:hypothetical protein